MKELLSTTSCSIQQTETHHADSHRAYGFVGVSVCESYAVRLKARMSVEFEQEKGGEEGAFVYFVWWCRLKGVILYLNNSTFGSDEVNGVNEVNDDT
ncbi:MAG: hypothetical protein IKH80_00180 [Bacteroidaceae bacterium]|nr:hypothetical protein [Bacteroidaceae bacterium]